MIIIRIKRSPPNLLEFMNQKSKSQKIHKGHSRWIFQEALLHLGREFIHTIKLLQTRVWMFFAHNLISVCLIYTNLTNFLHLFPHKFLTQAAKHLKKKSFTPPYCCSTSEMRFRTFTLLNLYTSHKLWDLLIHDSMKNSNHRKAPGE